MADGLCKNRAKEPMNTILFLDNVTSLRISATGSRSSGSSEDGSRKDIILANFIGKLIFENSCAGILSFSMLKWVFPLRIAGVRVIKTNAKNENTLIEWNFRMMIYSSVKPVFVIDISELVGFFFVDSVCPSNGTQIENVRTTWQWFEFFAVLHR